MFRFKRWKKKKKKNKSAIQKRLRNTVREVTGEEAERQTLKEKEMQEGNTNCGIN